MLFFAEKAVRLTVTKLLLSDIYNNRPMMYIIIVNGRYQVKTCKKYRDCRSKKTDVDQIIGGSLKWVKETVNILNRIMS